ncbi:MAG TPA: helix-turn-helix domain-containing protein [Candidatus Methanofastidiosa archaeon]|nr:helix-turn-helix domain-containing protein [Candidatus Methanofastidiosa archaeon]HPR41937.1 helix-turn-helix domain-containing protein [Candidatus Methanofastidiosa archaeon]
MINPFSKNLCSPNQIEGVDIYELVSGVLSLNELETSILFSLFDDNLSAVELSRRSGKHRSTIQKALSTLMGKGLIIRKKRGLRRGYHYTYGSISKSRVKDLMIKYIDDQTKCLIDRIECEL